MSAPVNAHRPRGSYASWSIAAGVSLFELARFTGTSVEQIDERMGVCFQTQWTEPVSRSTDSKAWRVTYVTRLCDVL